ncbi:hypothetical protein CK203_085829 [Vitis vinifera]|uniref:GAG-pre-integrase domain-containing protein n=1 Tax=Vitis vinifera TaxID=29760 RepID=A0A438DIJ4_VITVI|nr:hypothetical protein CK203_085829 [Vitis vinifera]
MVLTLISLRPNLECVRDQILASPLTLRLTLEEDVVAIGVEDNVLSAPIVISLVTLEIVAISYMDGLLALPTLLSHLIFCYLDLTHCKLHILKYTLTGNDYNVYLRYQAATSASIASIAQTDNVSVCFTQSPSLGPWILDSGASDHISGNKHLFSFITTTSALPTVTLANSSQTMAKGIGLTHPLPSLPPHSVLFALSDQSTGKTISIGREFQGLYHLTSPSSHVACISTDAPFLIHSRLGHPSLFKFQKMDKLSAKATKCIFFRYFQLHKDYRCYSLDTHRYFLSADVTFFEDSPFFSSSESLPISEVLPLPYISPTSDALSRPLQVYHRRHRAVASPLSLAEVPDDSPPVPPISPTPALSSTDHLPITLRKGN